MNKKILKSSLFAAVLLASFGQALADNLKKDAFEDRIPIPAEEVPQQEMLADDCSGVMWGVSAGVPTWFFESEDSQTGAGLYGDIRPKCTPLNIRLGVETRHMDAHQPAAQAAAEFPGKTTELTFVRVPLTVEYAHDISENTHWFAGLGPDLIKVSNDVSEWDVGFHLSTRVQYDITNNFNMGVEGGYMWNDVNGPVNDINLDTWFVTPSLGVSF
jgi:hypothetical protein